MDNIQKEMSVRREQGIPLFVVPDRYESVEPTQTYPKHPTCGHDLDGMFHYLRGGLQHGETRAGYGLRSSLVKCPHCTEENGRLRRVRLSVKRLEQMFPDADIPDYAKNWSFANFPASMDDIAMSTIASALEDSLKLMRTGETGISLFIYGATSSGKTSAATSCLRRYMEEGYGCLFLAVRKYIRLLQSASGKAAPEFAHLEELVLSVPVLVFDDLGSETPTDWALGKIFDVVEERGAGGLITIITSNNDLTALRKFWFKAADAEVQQQSGRIIRRLAERFRVVPMAGGDC